MSEYKDLIERMILLLPDTAPWDVATILASTDAALQLPIDDNFYWEIESVSRNSIFDKKWRVRLRDSHKRSTLDGRVGNSLPFAICQCWLTWKDAQDDG